MVSGYIVNPVVVYLGCFQAFAITDNAVNLDLRGQKRLTFRNLTSSLKHVHSFRQRTV